MNQLTMMTTSSIRDQFQTGNYVLDIIIGMIVGTVINSVLTYMAKYKESALYKKCMEFIDSFKKIQQYNIVTIEHDIDNEDPLLNNKILIDAILCNYDNGKQYKITNYGSMHCDIEQDMEKSKTILKKINEPFNEESILVEYEEVFKGKEENKVLIKHIITLTSSKSVNEISNYVNRKRDKYIDMFCDKGETQSIFTPYDHSYADIRFTQSENKSNKNFDSLFIKNKKEILEIISDFDTKNGVYKMKNIQHKLGLFLHGSPGCGKTSFIKALMNTLDRHVIIISLNKLREKSQIHNVFFNDYMWTRGSNDTGFSWKYIPRNKRIIIFEDIDTAGPMVMTRAQVEELVNNKSDVMSDRYDFVNKYSKPDDTKTKTFTKFSHSSNITLGDLLNIFDGVCELNGIVYVMTTNHKELLDPALIRPGRITIDLEMKNMEEAEIKEMLTYFYKKTNIKNKVRIINSIAKKMDKKHKPAQMENLCVKKKLCDWDVT